MTQEVEVGNVVEISGEAQKLTVVPSDSSVVATQNGSAPTAESSPKALRIGVVGNNVVARAMNVAFDVVKGTERKTVDGISELDSLIQWRPSLVYVCTDIPLLKNDTLDDAEFINTVSRLVKQVGCGICIRTTINIETLERLISVLTYDVLKNKVVYNPVMTDEDDIGKILSTEVEYFGGTDKALEAHMNLLKHVSNFSTVQFETGSIFDIVYVKLALSGFKAVKQTFFNQLHDVIVDIKGSNPAIVRRLIQKAPEFVDRSILLPTFIRSRGDDGVTFKQAKAFGGEYTNKDVKMFISMTDKFPILDECVNYKNLKD